MQKLRTLKIPVNPEYDFEQPPEGQFEYVNPVTVAYRQIYCANYAVDVTAASARLGRKLADLENEQDEAEAALENTEQDILSRFPIISSADSKSNKTIDAYIARVAHLEGITAYEEQRLRVRQLKAELRSVRAKINGLKQIADVLKLISEQGRTFLAYYKHEELVQRG